MAMFRSLVASAQQRQHPPAGAPASAPQPPAGPGAGGESGLEAQYSCPICLEVYHRPVAIGSCGHTFCGECLQPCLQVPSPLCPLCRMPFDPKKVDKASNVEKQLSSYKAPCRGCSKKVTLAKMRSHISSCMKVQEQMANCPKFVPVVPTSQPIPSNIPNRSTFVCPYCGARNLDQQELVKHCMENHRNDPNRVVLKLLVLPSWLSWCKGEEEPLGSVNKHYVSACSVWCVTQGRRREKGSHHREEKKRQGSCGLGERRVPPLLHG
ncbi:RING finger protein 166 isoform X3 [Vombatus ursinus]|uniref:RING finger protein 166 isoform X3 n=1 Tax=Vombatus ursinus TaxID=29139 RepID=UPI000FFCE1BC|nr:RING finger protein 166 isoform X3 [Vombatus ursinus]